MYSIVINLHYGTLKNCSGIKDYATTFLRIIVRRKKKLKFIEQNTLPKNVKQSY